MPVIRRDFGHLCFSWCYHFRTNLITCTEISSVLHGEFWSDLTASSAVNLPITRASLRLGVIRMGVRSTRCTYSVARVLPRFTFTLCSWFFTPSVRCCKELKEASTTHGHRSSPLIDPLGYTLHASRKRPRQKLSETAMYRIRINTFFPDFSVTVEFVMLLASKPC